MNRLFLDMDGVLVDFVRGVKELTGKNPWEFSQNLGAMWKAVAGTSDFYAKLHWMPRGKYLWDILKNFNPVLLTGVPRGHGWVDQKRKWIQEHLDPTPSYIIKYPGRSKIQTVFDHLNLKSIPSDETWILIDDTPRMGVSWVEEHGVFIHHTDIDKTISEFLEVVENRSSE